MRAFKKYTALLLCFAVCAVLCACAQTPPEAGRYNFCLLAEDGVSVAQLDKKAEIFLGSGGKGLISWGDTEGEFSWSIKGELLSLEISGHLTAAVLKDSCIALPLEKGTAYFLKEGAELPFYLSTEPALPDSYYGFWRIEASECSMPQTWIDCCGRIVRENGAVILKLWDEDGSEENPMGAVKLVLREDGVYESADGFFWYTELSQGDWVLDFGANELPSLAVLRGSALDSEGGSFEYSIYLRPWGTMWDDAAESAPELVPYHYESFYLPLAEAGQPMPGDFSSLENKYLP